MPRPAEPESVAAPPAGSLGVDSLLAPPDLDRTHRLGRAFVSNFYMTAKTVGMFEVDNVVARESLATFMDCLKEFFRYHESVNLQMASDCLFVNETRLRIDFEGFLSFRYVVEAMKVRGLGALLLTRGIGEAEVTEFLRIFRECDHRMEDPFTEIDTRVKDARLAHVEVGELWDLPDRPTNLELDENFREVSIDTYFKSIFVARQFMQNVRGGRVAAYRKARKTVHGIVDLVTENETTLLALTQIKNFDSFLFTHSTNVCVLSVVLGQALGLDKEMLGKLGLAAILHDVGMTEIPKELLGKRNALTRNQREIYERHPSMGAREILKNQGISESGIRSALVALEHHLQQDGSGFPRLRSWEEPSLLGRIVAITDFYDTITTPAPGAGGAAFSPEEALRLMVHGGQDVFDPVLVKLLVNSIGSYPLGTVVLLDTGEVGIVHRRGTNPEDPARPIVKITMDPNGEPIEPVVVDLSEPRADGLGFLRSITEVMPASEFFSDITEFAELL